MEYLDKGILLISCIFEIYIYYYFFRAFLELRDTESGPAKRIAAGCVAVACLFGINMIGNSYLNLFGGLMITWVYCVYVFRAGLGIRLLYYVMAVFIGLGCEFLWATLSGLSAHMLSGRSMVRLSDVPWQIFTMKLLTFVIMTVIKQCFGNSRKKLDNKVFLYYLCIPVASMLIMMLTYYAGLDLSADMRTRVLISLSFALMLIGNIAIFYAFNRYSEELYVNAGQELIISQQAMDLKYYEQVKSMESKYQEYIHNISHHLRTIGELARKNDYDSIVGIIRNLNIDLENGTSVTLCGNSVVNAVLSGKIADAENQDVRLDVYIEPGITFRGIADADIITMLGNLLDNAIRAAGMTDHREVKVRIFMENGGCFQIVKIRNHYAGDVARTENGFASTKDEKGIHGIGIKSVNRTAEKYDGFLECFAENNEFTSILVLPAK